MNIQHSTFNIQLSRDGLTEAEVLKNRLEHGCNILTHPSTTPLWKRYLEKFKDPLIIILLVAGALSACISLYEYLQLSGKTESFLEPIGIFIAIILATGLSFLFEYKADKEFALLNVVNDHEPVKVIREGKVTTVAKSDIVVDDIVIVENGDEIPADGIILESTYMNVDESSLTGEPICHKSARQDDFDNDATYPTNMLMRGSKVMEGNGIMKITAVGDMTENGKVFSSALIDNSVRTPLNEQLERLGGVITKVSYALAAMVIIGRILVFLLTEPWNNIIFLSYLLQSVMIAVTLIVVAVPEGLPMAVTLSLAYSMRKMLKSNNLVRKMHACETMGAATVICTDKTGTLTQNKMTVNKMFVFSDKERLIENICVNSTANLDGNNVIGNPTEGALLLWVEGEGFHYNKLRENSTLKDVIPFSTERKFMQTSIEDNSGKIITFTKGAPEIICDMCDMTADARDNVDKILVECQSKAMRTIAFSCGTTLLGIAAINDPVRDEVPGAIRECINAGIDVKIITGDTPITAKEIGRQIGISVNGEEDIATGVDIQNMTDSLLAERIKGIKIIARARPNDKKRIVEALQQKGEVVAVTGDGTNDAPALKAAHVGLSMGDGTTVAKEASDITIIDNSFCSIAKAVMWGRSLYKNIQRFILFQMTVNVVACLIVLTGAFLYTDAPLTVTQMLWVNIIMDSFAAMALASLPTDKGVMNDKPRKRSDFIVSPSMWRHIFIYGITFSVILMGLFLLFERYDVTSLAAIIKGDVETGNKGLSLYEHSLFFTIFVMMQFWNMFNAKRHGTFHNSFHDICHSKEFTYIMALIVMGQIVIVEFGGRMFGVTPLCLTDWIITFFLTSPVLIVGEMLSMTRRKKKTMTTI